MDSTNYQPDWLIQQWLLYASIIAHAMNSNPARGPTTRISVLRHADRLKQGFSFVCKTGQQCTITRSERAP